MRPKPEAFTETSCDDIRVGDPVYVCTASGYSREEYRIRWKNEWSVLYITATTDYLDVTPYSDLLILECNWLHPKWGEFLVWVSHWFKKHDPDKRVFVTLKGESKRGDIKFLPALVLEMWRANVLR